MSEISDGELGEASPGGRLRPKAERHDNQVLACCLLTGLEVGVNRRPQKIARMARRSLDAAGDDYWSTWVGQKHFGA